jgi:hypothetical protein
MLLYLSRCSFFSAKLTEPRFLAKVGLFLGAEQTRCVLLMFGHCSQTVQPKGHL